MSKLEAVKTEPRVESFTVVAAGKYSPCVQ